MFLYDNLMISLANTVILIHIQISLVSVANLSAFFETLNVIAWNGMERTIQSAFN